MGIDLRLLPVDSRLPGYNAGNCHTILNSPQNYDMFADLRVVATRLPDGHDFTAHLGARIKDGSHRGEPCYGRLHRDCYDELYTWVRADVLGPILYRHFLTHPVVMYVMALPADTMVVLDWH